MVKTQDRLVDYLRAEVKSDNIRTIINEYRRD